METIQTIVIGAGVIGLAVARKLAMSGHEVLILETENRFGTSISSRNSEVIHGGIYYPPESLKAILCVRGKRQLYHYCRDHHIPHEKRGKWLLATSSEQLPALRQLQQNARQNGVDDLTWHNPEDVYRREPAVRCRAALFSPSSGIIDSHTLMLSLLADGESHGAILALNSPVTNLEKVPNGFLINVADEYSIQCRHLINCAGLRAVPLARTILDIPSLTTYFAKGNYFSLTCPSPFNHLIYPLPEAAGLGIHVTLDLQGRARFGPDVEWIENIDYRANENRVDTFYRAIRRYWPDLPDDSLQPDYAGIRPKLHGPGQPAVDFLIHGPTDHGIPGLVNLLGMESPGLTACLAIADHVCNKLRVGDDQQCR